MQCHIEARCPRGLSTTDRASSFPSTMPRDSTPSTMSRDSIPSSNCTTSNIAPSRPIPPSPRISIRAGTRSITKFSTPSPDTPSCNRSSSSSSPSIPPLPPSSTITMAPTSGNLPPPRLLPCSSSTHPFFNDPRPCLSRRTSRQHRRQRHNHRPSRHEP